MIGNPSGRVDVAARKFALELPERAAERGHLRLEFREAVRQIAELRLRARPARGLGLRERQAHFIAAAPLHARADRLLLLRDVEIDDIGNVHRPGKDDARALIGNIADEAVDRAAPLVEVDAAAQKAFLAYRPPPFGHVRSPRPDIAAKTKPPALMLC